EKALEVPENAPLLMPTAAMVLSERRRIEMRWFFLMKRCVSCSLVSYNKDTTIWFVKFPKLCLII
ncbi:hypothetical protein GBA52_013026, partial [Prunus armeniaca]